MPYRDDDYSAPEESEYPEPDNEDAEDSIVASLVACPYCRKLIHEDAPRCHHCGNFHSAEDAPSRKPLWLVVTALVCLALILYGIWHGW